MSRMRHTTIAVALVAAFVVAPVILDECAASCGGFRAAGASTATPTCHHTSAPTPRLGRSPNGCGHDHTGALTMLSAAPRPVVRAFTSEAVVVPKSTPVAAAPADGIDVPVASPPHASFSRTLSASLRI